MDVPLGFEELEQTEIKADTLEVDEWILVIRWLVHSWLVFNYEVYFPTNQLTN
jgi:hypothetical protein